MAPGILSPIPNECGAYFYPDGIAARAEPVLPTAQAVAALRRTLDQARIDECRSQGVDERGECPHVIGQFLALVAEGFEFGLGGRIRDEEQDRHGNPRNQERVQKVEMARYRASGLR